MTALGDDATVPDILNSLYERARCSGIGVGRGRRDLGTKGGVRKIHIRYRHRCVFNSQCKSAALSGVSYGVLVMCHII